MIVSFKYPGKTVALNSRLGCSLTSLRTTTQPIRVTSLLDIGLVQRQVAAATAVVVTTVVATVVLTVVLAVLTVVLTVVLTAVLAILTVVASLAKLSVSNAGCKQHGQNCSETHDDEVVGMEYPVVEKVRVVKE
jgi:hypothetical protein